MLVPKLDEDQEYTNYLLNSLLNAMENKDKDKIISLFSKNIISNLQNIESDVDSLLEYFIGKPGIWDKQSPQIVDGSYEEDNKKIVICSSYDITTDESAYRIFIKACRVDSEKPDNVGIWSLYIISLEDDTDPKFVYWGDGNDTIGINIGVKNVLPD